MFAPNDHLSGHQVQKHEDEDVQAQGAGPEAAESPVGGVQMKGALGGATQAAGSALSHWAEAGVSGGGGALPHLDRIQRSFGPGHDVAGIESHVGGKAGTAAKKIGAEAYATQNKVAFAQSPDLHTAAHEAAHVVQQRAGVQLQGGVGQVGDPYERNADAIADRVVQGKSAADLLPKAEDIKYNGPAPRSAVQRKATNHDLDAGKLDKAGHDAHLDPSKVQAAIAFNNKRWTGAMRAQLLAFLRGVPKVDATESFNEGDVQHAARIQAGAGGDVDGCIGDGSMAILLNAGFKFSDDVHKDGAHPQGKVAPGEVTVEFWPGELEDMDAWNKAIAEAEKESAASGDKTPFRHLEAPEGQGRLYVKVNGKLVAKYAARGGPPRSIKDFGGHTADPTQGSFTMGRVQRDFTTPSWTMSTIPWGAHVRKGASGYEFQRVGASKWEPDRAGALDDGTFASLPKAPGASGGDVRTYNLNDFGAVATRLEGSPGFYLHTTPETEEQAALGKDVELTHSHGCVHLNPHERDEMIARGYLQQGVRFVCKKYDMHLLPNKARDGMMGK